MDARIGYYVLSERCLVEKLRSIRRLWYAAYTFPNFKYNNGTKRRRGGGGGRKCRDVRFVHYNQNKIFYTAV